MVSEREFQQKVRQLGTLVGDLEQMPGDGSKVAPTGTSSTMDLAFATLRRFARSKRPQERCELCSAGLGREHPHLVEIALRQVVCACEACATLFDGMAGSKYKRVSRRAQLLTDFQLTDGQWESLLIPINMAFFFRSSIEGRTVTLYPSPAGAVESLLPLDAWTEIVQENAVLKELQPDIEALLVNRVGHAHELSRAEYYIAPIDDCYRLVGLDSGQLERTFWWLPGLGGDWAFLLRPKITRGRGKWRSECLI